MVEPRHQTILQIPLAPGEWARLRAPFPVSEEEWDAMMRVLEAMRPQLQEAEGGG